VPRGAVAAALLVVLAGCGGGPTSAYVEPGATTAGASPSSTAGWPGRETTGVPDGTDLEPSGDLRITADGAVVDGLDIEGCVVVDASDVTIRNSRIRCADPDSANAVQITEGSRDFVMEDSEIDGLGKADIGVGWNNYTLRRVDIHSTADGVRLGSNTVVEDSWIHDLVRQGTLHGDAIQSTSGGNILVRGNTLDAFNAADDDLNNSAIMLGTETGQQLLADARFEGNYLNGGNYTVNIRGDANLQDVVFADNVYGPDHRYGPVRAPDEVSFDSDRDMQDGAPGAVVEVEDSGR
jgi:hypothetical protein